MFVLHENIGGLPPLETQPKILLIMKWVQQSPIAHQLSSSMGKLCLTLLPYPITAWMHIKLPHFLSLWLYLHLFGIPPCIFFCSTFPHHLCQQSCLPPKQFTVTCPHLSSGLGSDVVGLPSSSVPPCYS